MLKIIVIIQLILVFKVYGKINHDFVENLNAFERLIPDGNPHVVSIWGTCNARKINKRKPSNAIEKNIKLRSTFFESKTLDVNLSYPKNKKSSNSLIIYIPGSFAELKHTKRIRRDLIKNGHHVLSFSNSFAFSHIKGIPRYSLDQSFIDANIYYQGIKTFLRTHKNYKSINLISISSGAFLAAQLMYIISNRDEITLNKSLFIAPPFNMGSSIKTIDKNLKETRNNTSITPLLSNIKFFKKFCKWPLKIYSRSELQISKMFTSHLAFKRYMIGYMKAVKRVSSETFGPFKKQYRFWKKRFLISDYFRTYRKKVWKTINSEKGNLTYWIDKSIELKESEYFIITSKDDFINSTHHNSWPKKPNIRVMSKGGHFGYRGIPELGKLISSYF